MYCLFFCGTTSRSLTKDSEAFKCYDDQDLRIYSFYGSKQTKAHHQDL